MKEGVRANKMFFTRLSTEVYNNLLKKWHFDLKGPYHTQAALKS